MEAVVHNGSSIPKIKSAEKQDNFLQRYMDINNKTRRKGVLEFKCWRGYMILRRKLAVESGMVSFGIY